MKLALDCGELLPGHRFAITGLRQEGFSDDRLHVDLSDHRPGDRRDPMVSVTYELVPGLSEDETHAGLYVDATVELRPTRLAAASGAVPGSVPGERDSRPDQSAAAGAFGPFRCPDETSEIILHLGPIQVRSFASDGTALNADAEDRLASTHRSTGQAVIDLSSGTSRWTPDSGERP